MRKRWSTPQWRFAQKGHALEVNFKDGTSVAVTLEEAQGIDPTDVESVSIFIPNTECETRADKQTNDAYLELADMWRSYGIPMRGVAYV